MAGNSGGRGAPEARGAILGRDRELAAVVSMFDTMRVRGQVRLIIGEPGIGKTALLAAAAAGARRRGVTVLTARGAASEQHLPFAALHDLLRPLVERDHAANLAPGRRKALFDAFGMSETVSPPKLFFVALAALDVVSDACSRQPLLLVVDDYQWLDAASRDVIDFVARRLVTEPAVLLIATRPDHAHPPNLLDTPDVEVEVLGALDDASAGALLLARAPDLPEALRDHVLAEAAGNPLALLELPVRTRSESSSPPRSGQGPALTARLERAFAPRLPELGAPARLLLLVVALNDSDRLSEAIGAASIAIGQEVGLSRIDEAVGLGLVWTDGETVRFPHPLVRSAVVHSVSAATRRSAHRALAQALSGDADRHAWHSAAAAAGPDEAVAQLTEAAADRAMRRGLPSSAVAWWEKAAGLSPEEGHRGRRLLRAAEAAFQLGNADDVRRFTDQSRSLRLEVTERGLFSFLDGDLDNAVPQDAEGVRLVLRSATRARDDGAPEAAAMLLVEAATLCWCCGAGQPIRDELLATADSLPLAADDPRVLTAWGLSGAAERRRRAVDALDRWSVRSVADPATESLLSRTAFVCGEYERSLAFGRSAADGLRRQGRLGMLAQLQVRQSFAATALGRWDLAGSTAQEAHRLASKACQPIWAASAALALAYLSGLRGSLRQSVELLDEFERVALCTGIQPLMTGAQMAKGLRELGQGHPAEAFGHLRKVVDGGDRTHHPITRLWAIDYFAEAALGAGETGRARPIVRDLEPVLETVTGTTAHRPIRLAQALLAPDSEAEAAFTRAFDLAEGASPWYRARLDLAHGMWLRRRRHGAGARAPLQSAHAVFETLGARAWAKRSARELRASGVKGQPAPRSAAALLTPQELQIARLAAEGLSNRDISNRLYLSHRTVGSHLYRIFPKLGITSRTQLPAALSPCDR
ncbi:helix-turn-helix transcriptional regulator [Streptomyces sp. x-80]|uniref:helix-turn-helix transcriptional regulator n=1 Tax=Streptomyces sp. x-80 TaxID=2789282 RepID=UPI00397FDF3E